MPKTHIDEAKGRSGFTDKLSTILKATYEYLKKSGTLLGTKKSPLEVINTTNPLEILIKDFAGNQSLNSGFLEAVTGEYVDQISRSFEWNNSTTETYLNQTGTATYGHGGIGAYSYLRSGTGIGEASIISKDTLRYHPGHMAVSFGTIKFDIKANIADTEGGLGIGDNDNFAGFVQKDGVLGIKTIFKGIENFIPQDQWNKDTLLETSYNPNAMNIYFIFYGWLGVFPISFCVYTRQKGWVLVHQDNQIDNIASPHFGNTNLPMKIYLKRTQGVGADIELRTGSWRGGIIGNPPKETANDRRWVNPQEFNIRGTDGYKHIVTYRNKSIYASRTNYIKSVLETFTASSKSDDLVTFEVFRDLDVSGQNWVSFDVDESPLEYLQQENGTLDETPPDVNGYFAKRVGIARISEKGDIRLNLVGDVTLGLRPGETLTFTCRSDASQSLKTTLDTRMKDLF